MVQRQAGVNLIELLVVMALVGFLSFTGAKYYARHKRTIHAKSILADIFKAKENVVNRMTAKGIPTYTQFFLQEGWTNPQFFEELPDGTTLKVGFYNGPPCAAANGIDECLLVLVEDGDPTIMSIIQERAEDFSNQGVRCVYDSTTNVLECRFSE